ncbi:MULTISPECIES: hypothetical protein, partial [unclassified Pseudomonas]|uniref:hypothetical protein n=1 Tax=unclassified Pseudomonas TaxID=196821 RepID=UPI00224B9EC7
MLRPGKPQGQPAAVKRWLTVFLNAVLFTSRDERSKRVKCLKLNEFLAKKLQNKRLTGSEESVECAPRLRRKALNQTLFNKSNQAIRVGA